MKRIQAILLTVSVGINVFLAFSIAKQTTKTKESLANAMGPFSITNLNASTNGGDYIVAYKNGIYWWNIDGETISINIGLKEGAILRLDESTGKIKSTTIELSSSNGVSCYFTDMNADGFPDKKRVGGDENWQIFYNGEFVPSFSTNGERYIMSNGISYFVKFNGERWVIQK